MSAEVGRELIPVGCARGGCSQGIDQQPGSRQAQAPQQPRGQEDDFRVHVRPFEAKRLRVDLMELAVAPRLRPFAPEHRSHAPHPQTPIAQHAVRDDRAHDARSRFGAQCNVVLALIDEAEHLLLDDIREIADRALE